MGNIKLKQRNVPVGTFKATPLMKSRVLKVLESGIISYGPNSKQFEQRFAELHGNKYGILSNSGTSSLHVALQAMKEEYGWKDGDEVIVPVTTFVATANIVKHCRMTPVFGDADASTYNLIPDDTLITDKTRAIIPAHLFGQTAHMQTFKIMADVHNLKTIEDACETMFVDYMYTHSGSKPVGSLGDIACFSMYVAHILVSGVGGISITNDPALAARMRSLVNHGLMIEHLNPDENFAPRPAVGRRFQFSSIGHSYRITEMEAALALVQLADYERMLAIRRRNAMHLTSRLTMINIYYDTPFTLPYFLENTNTHAWMMYPIIMRRDGEEYTDKEPVMKWLNDHGIETRDMPTLLGHPCYADEINPDDFPVSKLIWKSGFYIGCHQGLEPEDIDYVIQVLEEYLNDKQK
jgi:perosamine synthetase